MARPVRRMGQSQISARQSGPEPQAAGARLCRYLLLAPLRPRHAAGRDDDGARSRGSLRSRSLCRTVLLQFQAHARGGGDPAGARHPLLDPPAELFDDQPMGRGGWSAGDPRRAGHRLDRILAPGAGHADVEISRRHSRRQSRSAGKITAQGVSQRPDDQEHSRARRDCQAARADARTDGACLGPARRPCHLGADRRQPAQQVEDCVEALDNREFDAEELAEIDRYAREADINLWAASAERKGPARK